MVQTKSFQKDEPSISTNVEVKRPEQNHCEGDVHHENSSMTELGDTGQGDMETKPRQKTSTLAFLKPRQRKKPVEFKAASKAQRGKGKIQQNSKHFTVINYKLLDKIEVLNKDVNETTQSDPQSLLFQELVQKSASSVRKICRSMGSLRTQKRELTLQEAPSSEEAATEFESDVSADNAISPLKPICEAKLASSVTISENWVEEKPCLSLATGEKVGSDTKITWVQIAKVDAPGTKDSKYKIEDMESEGEPSTQREGSKNISSTKDTRILCDSTEITKGLEQKIDFITSQGNDTLNAKEEVPGPVQSDPSNLAVEQTSAPFVDDTLDEQTKPLRLDNELAVHSQSFSVAEYKRLGEVEINQMEHDESCLIVKLTPLSQTYKKAARNLFAHKMVCHSSSLVRLLKSTKARSHAVTSPNLDCHSQLQSIQDPITSPNGVTNALPIEVSSSTDKTEATLSSREDEGSTVAKGTRLKTRLPRTSDSVKAGIDQSIIALHTLGETKMFQRKYPKAAVAATPKSCTIVNYFHLNEIEIEDNILQTSPDRPNITLL
jgi:hypothetical protein